MSRIKTTFTAFILLSIHAAAQDTARSLDPVIVSANKYPQKASRTGKMVTVISRQDLERSGSKDLAQVLNEQGGIYINGANSHPGKDKSVFMRGARPDHTLITIDGIPVYDATGIGSNFDIRQIPVESIERIEILKGSQGTLYGSDAIAGAVNIITRKAAAKSVEGSALLSYGSWNSLRAAATVQGRSGRFSYSVGSNYFRTDGISEAEVRENVGIPFEKDGYRQQGVQANFGFQVNPQIRVAPFLRVAHMAGDIDQQAFVDELDYTYTARNLQAGVINEAMLGKTRLHLLYQFNKTRRDYLDDSVESRNGFYRFYETAYRSNEHFAELYTVHSFSGVQLTSGIDFRRSATEQTGMNDFGAEPGVSPDSSQRQLGIYTALHVPSGPFHLEAGARYNHHSNYGSNLAWNLNPSLLLRERLKLFVNFSTGYKTPSLFQLYSVYGNRNLEPETALNLEGGFQLVGAKAMLQAAYFSRRVKEVLFFYFDPVTFQSQYINQDEQNDHGVEAQLKWQLTPKIDARLFYTFLDGAINTKTNGKDTTYNNLIRRPKHAVSSHIGGNLFKNFHAALQLNYFGTSRDLYFDPATFESRTVTLDGYILLHLTVEYGFLNNRLKVFADLRNLTNKKYSELYGYSTPGFNGYLGVRLRW